MLAGAAPGSAALAAAAVHCMGGHASGSMRTTAPGLVTEAHTSPRALEWMVTLPPSAAVILAAAADTHLYLLLRSRLAFGMTKQGPAAEPDQAWRQASRHAHTYTGTQAHTYTDIHPHIHTHTYTAAQEETDGEHSQ